MTASIQGLVSHEQARRVSAEEEEEGREAELKESATRDKARPHSRLMLLAQAWFHAGSSSVVLKK